MIQKIRQWLIDTYNGLYVIVLKPHMPTYVTVFAVVVAMLFGIFWGYVISPVRYYDGAPYQMSSSYRDEWVKGLAAARYSGAYTNDEEVLQRLRLVEAPSDTIQRLIDTEPDGSIMEAALFDLMTIAPQAEPGTPAPRPVGVLQEVLTLLLPVIVIIVLALIVSPIWRLLFRPNIVDPVVDRLRPKSAEELERRKRAREERDLMIAKREQEEALKKESVTASATNPYGAAMIQKLSIYTKGRSYDDSFAIEDEDNNFYGECGVTIAKQTNGELVAVECWLFDKEDFVRTLTKVYVAEGSYNDPAVISELETRVDNPATDIIPLKAGGLLTLETDQLLIHYKVADVRYGPGNTYLDGLTIQVSAWYKKRPGAPAVVQAVPVAMPAAPAYTPPPVQPTQQTYAPPPAQPPAYNPQSPQALPFDPPQQRPMAPPPPSRPPEDDPFGGTGDFTPISG